MCDSMAMGSGTASDNIHMTAMTPPACRVVSFGRRGQITATKRSREMATNVKALRNTVTTYIREAN